MAKYQANRAQSHSLRRRLLRDIEEVKQDPYPSVDLKFDDNDITKACLILTSEGRKPPHLTISFPDRYPLIAPKVTIQSHIVHPNVFNDRNCVTMLDNDDGWTPAYSLKGIVVQLLSFFCSGSVEQNVDNVTVDIFQYRKQANLIVP